MRQDETDVPNPHPVLFRFHEILAVQEDGPKAERHRRVIEADGHGRHGLADGDEVLDVEAVLRGREAEAADLRITGALPDSAHFLLAIQFANGHNRR